MSIYNNVVNNNRKRKLSKRTIVIIIAIIVLFNTFIYIFDKNVLPAVLQLAEIEMKNKATDIIYTTCTEVYTSEFSYDEMLNIQKDEKGSITLIQVDTVKLNKLSSKMVLQCNEKLEQLQDMGVEVPLGFMTNNSVVYRFGPRVTIKMSQVGNIATDYESVFESAGINQTRHKIYLNVNVTMRVVVPLHTKDVDITCQIPISETIIKGDIPQTAIDMGNK